MRFGRIGFIAVAVVSAVVGAHSLNPRELYNEMYPVETLKRDAFQICGDADPTFIRAVGAEREACYNSMPNLIAVALGRARPADALTMAALIDPSRQAELLMLLAAMPPRQPITVPRSFANTEWVRALSPPCDGKDAATPAASYTAPSTLPSSPSAGRTAALDSAIRNNLPPIPRAAQTGAHRDALPVLPLTGGPAISPPSSSGDKSNVAAFDPAPAPDIGDVNSPAIIPLAPASACGGA
jgi:hypothetical protein